MSPDLNDSPDELLRRVRLGAELIIWSVDDLVIEGLPPQIDERNALDAALGASFLAALLLLSDLRLVDDFEALLNDCELAAAIEPALPTEVDEG